MQYNPPVTAEDYVHRVGRTARVGKCGQAMIFLSPSETEFVTRLGRRGVKYVICFYSFTCLLSGSSPIELEINNPVRLDLILVMD